MESPRCQERHVVPTIDEPIRRRDERRDVAKVRSRREHDASHRRFLRRKQHAAPTHNPYVTVCHTGLPARYATVVSAPPDVAKAPSAPGPKGPVRRRGRPPLTPVHAALSLA